MKRRWRSERFRRWLDRRVPPAAALALSHRNVFILPSAAGWVFALLLIAMLLTAINYQNSLVYALTFWLVSMSLASMWLTFRNLAGLHLRAGHAESCFAGETVFLPLRLSVKTGWRAGLLAGFPGDPVEQTTVVPGVSQDIRIPLTTRERGVLRPRRIKLTTRYPFGLFTAWSWVALEYPVVIYPRPEHLPLRLSSGAEDPEGESARGVGSDPEFSGIRDYRPGDSMKLIAWKHSAASDSLKSKEYETEEGGTCWLDWEALTGETTEYRLSVLTSWVLQAEEAGIRYGLSLPDVVLEPSRGEQHQTRCLRTLALWEGR
ncbi:DUF58 domain-containing protein [uncultured Thalassolituus sp.]|uniref:DUF58 domain-containing protein n=1 Tax=uncultured Thalassolituus sp. TaxID=285273 RepID=UPI00262CBB89|nr:DUF58 domain-containing protein [uncultured Thalassolituus sp.]